MIIRRKKADRKGGTGQAGRDRQLPDPLSGAERAAVLPAVGLLLLCLGRLFYRSLTAGLLLSPLGWGMLVWYRREKTVLRQDRLRMEFVDAMDAYISALKTGYSAENALFESGRQLRRIYGKSCRLAEAFGEMQLRLSVNEPLERLFTELAERTGLEEVSRMAEIFVIARRDGGILITVMEDTVRSMRTGERLRREIRVQSTARRTEFLVMAVMPAGMLAYLEATAPAYMDPLYQGWIGRLLMTVLLLAYAGVVRFGLRVMKAAL